MTNPREKYGLCFVDARSSGELPKYEAMGQYIPKFQSKGQKIWAWRTLHLEKLADGSTDLHTREKAHVKNFLMWLLQSMGEFIYMY